MYIYNQTGI